MAKATDGPTWIYDQIMKNFLRICDLRFHQRTQVDGQLTNILLRQGS